MRFKDIIGQKQTIKYLTEVVDNKKISHAYLLYGLSGTGKLALAIAFAQYLSCNNHIDNDSCGECPACIKFEKLIHPDLHFVFPVISASGKKPVSDSFIHQWRERILRDAYFSLNEWLEEIGSENKQGSIYSEESAEIIKKLNLKTFESDYKCMIIWLPEKMNVSCANKLLKILEEPPEKTVFLLITDNREDVLPTVISRTQPLKVMGIDGVSLISALKKEFGEEQQNLAEICKLSRGSYLKAKNYIHASEETKYNFENFVEIMRLAYARNIGKSIEWATNISKIGREKQKSFLDYGLKFIRENFVYDYNNQEISYMLKLEKEFAQKFSPFINEKNTELITEEFEKAHYHIERNANAKILFTDLSFKIMKLIR